MRADRQAGRDNGGVAYILPEPAQHQCETCGQPLPRFTSVPPAAPSGWECPRCHRIWNPSVLACHNCPEPPAFIAKTGIYPVHIDGMTCDPPCKDGPCGGATAMSLHLPAEMTRPGHQRYVRITGEWSEIMPGLQCHYGGTDPAMKGVALINLRLTPEGQ
jgi:hypothetical protein